MIYLLAILAQVNAIYFYLEKDMTRCFKDELVKNYTLEMKLFILDKDVVDNYE